MSEIKPALSCDLHDGKITIISLQEFTLNVGPNYFYTAADVDRALAAAQKDAERYRWLRDGFNELVFSYPNGTIDGGSFCNGSATELDAAIDAAMQEKRDE